MQQLRIFDTSQKTEKKSKAVSWRLFVDGASRKNPGLAGAGLYIEKEHEPFFKKGFFLGIKTNNQAEYLSLILGLFYCKKHLAPDDHITIMADSELLIKQLKGIYKVRNPELKELYLVAHVLLKELHYSLHHIVREKNSVADEMANLGIDKRAHPTKEFLTFLLHHAVTL